MRATDTRWRVFYGLGEVLGCHGRLRALALARKLCLSKSPDHDGRGMYIVDEREHTIQLVGDVETTIPRR